MDHFLLEFGIRALLVAAGTGVVLVIARVRTASARHIAWAGVLILMMLLPLWTAWGPRVSLKVLPAKVSVPLAGDGIVAADPIPTSGGTTAAKAGLAVSQYESRPWEVRHVLAGIYVAVAGVLLLRLLLGTIRAHLLIRRATVCDGLLTSASCASPITVGWFRPVAILPERWRQWPQRQLDAVLTHEREHARRHDPLVQWLALLNRAIFWFHPLAWWLERQLSALAEEACDAAVLARGHAPQDYSEYLLGMADSVRQAGRRVSLVGMAMPGGFLARRIPRLFDDGVALRVSRARMIFVIVACAISSVAFAAGVLERREVPREVRLTLPQAPVAVTVPREPERSQPVLVAQAAVPTPQQTPAAPPQSPDNQNAPFAIEIDVRIVAANRGFSWPPGIDLTTTANVASLLKPGGDVALDEILAAAEARGTARLLSRPKVTTLNGVPAQISLGTQLPVQTTVNGVTTVSFLTFSRKIEITPNTPDGGLIYLHVSVENSQPDFSRAVNGVPASPRDRSSDIAIRIADGDSVLIGGIFDGAPDVRQVPGLGAIPVAGALFRGAQPTDDEQILIITPRIKAP